MTHINQRRDTAANWASSNPVLLDGEVGWETDAPGGPKSKLGDGVTHWNDLLYTAAAISATKADVGLDQVDNTSDLDKPISTATQAALDGKADDADLAAAAPTSSVRVASNGTVTLSGAQTVDGVVLADGDKVLYQNGGGGDNGVYVVNTSGAWPRDPTLNTSAKIAGRTVAVREGTTWAGKTFKTTFKATDTIGVTQMNWYQVADTNSAQSFINKNLSSPLNIFPAAPDVQIFTVDGTWTKPTGAKTVVVEMVGGGGSGGACPAAVSAQNARGSGGGYGAYAWKKFDASALTATVAVDVGAGGAPPAAGANNGNAGATSSFGAFVVAPGGGGGLAGASNAADFWIAGGAGGLIVGAVGDLLIPGEPGCPSNGNGSLGMSGQGGSGRFGAGGAAKVTASAGQSIAGALGQGFGSGGSGGLSTSTGAAAAGGGGAPGIVIVTTYFM